MDQKPLVHCGRSKSLKVNRRTFLKYAGMAAGALALPVAVPKSVFGAQAPSERIVMGFIGTGKQSQHLLRSFLNASGVQVAANCDVDKLKLERNMRMATDFYAKKTGNASYNGVKAYGDFRELLARPDIDAVVISTPDHWHGLHTVYAAKAGKDIYCEKPLGHNIVECQAMVKAVRRYDRVFQTGSMQRSDDKFRRACELVINGYIGDTKKVVVNVGGPPKACDLEAMETPDYLDWEMWNGPAPARPYHSELSPHISQDIFPHWRSYKEYGGGGMTDWGAHHFDITQWGLGMDRNGPVEVIPPDGKEVKVLTYTYANGITMVRAGSEEGHGNVNGVLFLGDKGKVEVNRGYLKTWPENLAGQKIGPNETRLYDSSNHYTDWLHAIRTRTKPICDVEIGYSSVVVCLMGNIAYELKRPLRYDQRQQRFLADNEANLLMGRVMRSPWRI
ncbi:MAG: Gfo/Idh/MocA family oxidoreductase [Sedimentisphaerales bacterium]|nr:Gfo/Idh/MocA family oxidoreductase [Sedimentisphaerales bacterium]